MLLRRLLPAAALLGLACARPAPPPPAPAQAPAPPAPAEDVRTPLVVRWREVERGRDWALLAATIRRHPMPGSPVRVQVLVPAGVFLDGDAQFEVPPSDLGVTVEKSFRVSWTELPDNDLVLAADAGAEDFGVHAEDVWRFGRPAPEPPAPRADGPDLELGGHRLGPAVPVGR